MAADSENVAMAAVFTAMKAKVVVAEAKAEEAVKFYKEAFGAEELKRAMNPKRKADQELPFLLSAELKIGDAVFVVAGEIEDGIPMKEGNIVFQVETEDVAAAALKAVGAGAVQDGDVAESDGPCGGLYAKLKDPFGVVWIISSAGNKCAEAAAPVAAGDATVEAAAVTVEAQ